MKFKKVIQNMNPGVSFDLNESTTKAGQKYVYYDVIQAGRTDTEIIPTLKKYGCLDPMLVNKEQLYIDLTNFKNGTDLRSLTEMTKQADEMWNQLPSEVKEKFENNRDIFMRDGEKWLKKEIEKQQQETTPDLEQATGAETKGE